MTVMSGKSEADAAYAIRRSVRMGWTVVGSASVMMFVTFGAVYSYAAFFASLQQAFGASRSEVSLAFSIAIPLFYLMGAVSGPLADRYGARLTCLVGVIVGGSGLLFAAAASTLWQVYVGFGLGLGLGIGFTYVPAISAVQRWFVTRRGFASGVTVSGIGFGTLLMPLFAAELISRTDWRGAWSVFGLIMLIVGGAAALVMDNSPERRGALPDGGVIGIGIHATVGPVQGASLREAIRSRPFFFLYSSLIVIWIGASVPFVHLVPYAEDHGLSHRAAVAIFGLVGIGSIVGRFLLGAAADRFSRRRLLAAAVAGISLSQLWLLGATTTWQLALFSLVFGACYGGFVALYAAITVDYFGRRNASGIIGCLYTAGAVGSFFGPMLAGAAFDVLGSYEIPIAAGAGCAALAAAFLIAAPEPIPHSHR
jgi:MFS family permease